MIILSSPAKTQDFSSEWSSHVKTEPEFFEDAGKIVEVLKSKSKAELAQIMQVSPKLAELNFERYKTWSAEEHRKNGKPAILAYRGDIFKQMYPLKYTEEQQKYAQKSVRFLTGLYGMLRAYDVMLPYRLEMKAVVKVNGAKDLNEFWQGKLTASLNRELNSTPGNVLVDAASGEYSKPINFEDIEKHWVRIEFRQLRGGQLENVGILSKKARGMLLEYCVTNTVESLEELKKFNVGGYKFHSEDTHQVMFVRKA